MSIRFHRTVLSAAAVLFAASCAAHSASRAAARTEPVPPDPQAITVFGRYQPSLESLAPAGVEVGDMNLVDGRLVIHVHAGSEAATKAFAMALERSGWYRDARREGVAPGGLRQGELVLSVAPTGKP